MYQVISGENNHFVDDITYIKLNKNNGCYNICDKEEAEGICVKIPKEITNEDGNTIVISEDNVFTIKDGGLKGTEDLCTIEPAKIAVDYFNAKRAEELMNMLEEVL